MKPGELRLDYSNGGSFLPTPYANKSIHYRMFEYVYFVPLKAVTNNTSVYRARLELGVPGQKIKIDGHKPVFP